MDRPKTERLSQREINAECLNYARCFYAVTGRKARIMEIPASQDDIGYTCVDLKKNHESTAEIHISFHNVFLDGLNKKYQIIFTRGVFVHEMLHQVFTDSKFLARHIENLPPGQKREGLILSNLNNILEDMAIEAMADRVVGGLWLRCLKYMIKRIYDLTDEINTVSHPFNQFIAALIQFGDKGIIKGHFTYPEARKCFLQAAPVMFTGTTEYSPAKRFEASKQIFEIARPLWEPELEKTKQMEDLMKELSEMLNKMGAGKPSSSPCPKQPSSAEKEQVKPGMSKQMQRTLQKLAQEDPAESPMPADSGSQPETTDKNQTGKKQDAEDKNQPKNSECGNPEKNGVSDTNKDICKDETKTEEKTGEGSENPGKSNHSVSDDSDELNSNIPVQNDTPENTADTNGEENDMLSDEPAEKTAGKENDCCRNLGTEPSGETEISFSEEDFNLIRKEIETAASHLKSIEYEEKDTAPDLSGIEVNMNGLNCSVSNYDTIAGNSSQTRCYQQLVHEYSSTINNLSKQFSRIIKREEDEKERRYCGQINLKRYISNPSGRIFDRRRAVSDKSDTAFLILVDESGSMSRVDTGLSRRRYEYARDAAIVLTEALQRAGLPVYVMGFSADEGYAANHFHYVKWNSKNNASMLNICARCNNYDGFSIRYAGQILKKRPEQHKILFLISDGYPACHSYPSKNYGFLDTNKAVKEVRKYASLYSIAIGNVDGTVMKAIYEEHFTKISNPAMLCGQMIKSMKKIFQRMD